MGDYTPTPEQVEAAARVIAPNAWDGWADMNTHRPTVAAQRDESLAVATAALTAAGPLIERAVAERIAAALEGERDKPLAGEPTARSEGVRYGLNRADRIARGEGA